MGALGGLALSVAVGPGDGLALLGLIAGLDLATGPDGLASLAHGTADFRANSVLGGPAASLLSRASCTMAGDWDPGSCTSGLDGSVPGSGIFLGSEIGSAYDLGGLGMACWGWANLEPWGPS